MAVREAVTKKNIVRLFDGVIAADGNTQTVIFDTADADLGVGFYMSAPVLTDGTYTITVEHGDDPALADTEVLTGEFFATVVTDLDLVNTGLSTQTDDLGMFAKAGVHSHRRYLRATIVATGVTAGAEVQLLAGLHAEVCPV